MTDARNGLGMGFQDAYTVMLVAIALATPLFIVFGALSDRIGRKPIILGGCLIAAIAYVPIYMAMHAAANPMPGTRLVGTGRSSSRRTPT